MSDPFAAAEGDAATGLLSEVRVLDLSPLYAGAFGGALLADLGANVISVEHPTKGSPMRTMLPKKEGDSLWWKTMSRGKRCITLDLSRPEGQELARRLAAKADIVIENFRPGTLERWNLGPDDLAGVCERLVMLRISGFGQSGPARERPGYGTIAEAMSGFANLNGEPDRQPAFPSVSLADGVSGLFGAFGALAALVARLTRPDFERGVQVVDVALFEALFRLIPVQILAYDQLGLVMSRPGNFLGSHGVLRNLYTTRDGVDFCVSAIGAEPIRRILVAADAAEIAGRLDAAIADSGPAFEALLGEADEWVGAWAGREPWQVVEAGLRASDAVFERIHDASTIVEHPQFAAREDLIDVPDSERGSILMPGVVPKFPGVEHRVSHAGPRLAEHNDEVLRGLGLSDDDLERLQREKVI